MRTEKLAFEQHKGKRYTVYKTIVPIYWPSPGELAVPFAVQSLCDRKVQGLTEVLAKAGCFEVALHAIFEETALRQSVRLDHLGYLLCLHCFWSFCSENTNF